MRKHRCVGDPGAHRQSHHASRRFSAMSGHKIKLGNGYEIDKHGKLRKSKSYGSVSQKIARRKSTKQKVVRRSPT
jgi:hypothetical protein